MFEGAGGLVFGIEVEECDWDLIGLTPLGKGEHDASFADAAFAAHGKDDSFFDGAVLMIAGKRLEIIGAGLNHKRECFLNPSWRSR